MKIFIKTGKILFFSLFVSFVGQAQKKDPTPDAKEVLIIASTDFHGALEGETSVYKSQKIQWGGAGLLDSYVRSIKTHF